MTLHDVCSFNCSGKAQNQTCDARIVRTRSKGHLTVSEEGIIACNVGGGDVSNCAPPRSPEATMSLA